MLSYDKGSNGFKDVVKDLIVAYHFVLKCKNVLSAIRVVFVGLIRTTAIPVHRACLHWLQPKSDIQMGTSPYDRFFSIKFTFPILFSDAVLCAA